MRTTFWSENMKGLHRLGDAGVDGRIILEWILKIVRTWTGFIWLRTGSSGGLLWTR